MKTLHSLSKVNLKKIKLEYILLAIILIFGLFLRVYALGNPPLWVDEAISASVSKNILIKGVPILDSGWHYNSAYVLHYSIAFFMLFGQNEFWARFPSIIFGLLTILLAYVIGKEYSKTGGIISALFFSVFYLEVFFSRQARFYQLFQLAFFASLYFLYKSKEKPVYLIPAIALFFLALDTHLEALILAPFFILHILYYNKKQWFASILPAIPLINKLIPASKLSALQTQTTINYASNYYSFAHNMRYLLILFIPGLIWSFFKTSETSVSDSAQNSKNSDKKRLTALILLPSIITLIGIFTLKTFALRYSYFFVFPLVLYSSLLLSFLYEKYGKIMLISIFLLLIFPSNLFFPSTYVNIIKPIDYNFNDYSAPYTDYKAVPANIINELKSNTILISYYSPDVEWYIRKPDYVLPFSMDGRGNDQISMNNSKEEIVDMYSGALILKQGQIPNKPYNLIADDFSVSKLKPSQRDNLNSLIKECNISYENNDVKIYECK